MTQAARAQQPPAQDDIHREAAMGLLTVTSDLTKLLTDESNLLTQGASQSIEALAPRKAELFAGYQKAMGTIKAIANPRLILDDALRKSLREAAIIFKAALERNQTLLKSRLETSQNLMQTIGAEVQRQQNPVKTYQAPLASGTKQAPTSLAVNQTI